MGEVHSIWLKNEIPKFRSGVREIEVLSIGRDWVRVKCNKRVARISKKLWVDLITAGVKRRAEANEAQAKMFKNKLRLGP